MDENDERLKNGFAGNVFRRLFIALNDPTGPGCLMIPYGRTHGILNGIIKYLPSKKTRTRMQTTAHILPFLPNPTDKAVPANRECGLYDIPVKRN